MTDVLSLDVRGSSINNPAVDVIEEADHLDMIQPQWGKILIPNLAFHAFSIRN